MVLLLDQPLASNSDQYAIETRLYCMQVRKWLARYCCKKLIPDEKSLLFTVQKGDYVNDELNINIIFSIDLQNTLHLLTIKREPIFGRLKSLCRRNQRTRCVHVTWVSRCVDITWVPAGRWRSKNASVGPCSPVVLYTTYFQRGLNLNGKIVPWK